MDAEHMAESLRARAQTFAALRGGHFSMDPVSGRALNNQIWRVDTGHEVFALRVPPTNDVLGIDRTAEAWALRAAAAAGASPRLVDSDPSGLLLLDWIDGRELEMTAFSAGSAPLMQAAALVKSAQVSAPPMLRALSRVLAGMLDAAVSRGATIPSALGIHLERQRVSEERAADDRPIILTHLDPWPNNFLDDGTRLWLVDWEFAAATDGMSDVAVLAMSAGIPVDGIRDGAADHLLDLFGRPEERERLVEACGEVTLFEAIWGLAAHAGHGSAGQYDYRAHAERLLLDL